MKFYSSQAILCVLLCGLSLKQATWAANSTTTLAPSNVESLPVMIMTNQSLSLKASVPIELPPGTAQYAPQLHLEYNSHAPHISPGELEDTRCIATQLHTTVSLTLHGMSKLWCAKLSSLLDGSTSRSRFRVKWARSPHSPPILKMALDNGQCFSRSSANAPWVARGYQKDQCLAHVVGDSNLNAQVVEFKWAYSAAATPAYENSLSDRGANGTALSHWSLRGTPFIQPCQHQPQNQRNQHGYLSKLCLVNGQREQIMEFEGLSGNTTHSQNNQQRPAIYRLINELGQTFNHLHITLTDKTLIINNRLSGEQKIFKQPKLTQNPIYLITESHIKPFTQNLIRYDWQFVDSPGAKVYRINKIFYGKNTGVVSDSADSTPERHFNHSITFDWFNNRATSFPQFIHIGSRLGLDGKNSSHHDIRYTYSQIPSHIGDKNPLIADALTGLHCNAFYDLQLPPAKLQQSPAKWCTNIFKTPLTHDAITHKPTELFDYFRISGITKIEHLDQPNSRTQRATFFYDTCTNGHGGCLHTVIQGDLNQSWAKKVLVHEETYGNKKLVGLVTSSNTGSPWLLNGADYELSYIFGLNPTVVNARPKLFNNIHTVKLAGKAIGRISDKYHNAKLQSRQYMIMNTQAEIIASNEQTFLWDYSHNGLLKHHYLGYRYNTNGDKQLQQDSTTVNSYTAKCFDEAQQLIVKPNCDSSNKLAILERTTTIAANKKDLNTNNQKYLYTEQVFNNANGATTVSQYQCQRDAIPTDINTTPVCSQNEKTHQMTHSPITDVYTQDSQDVMRNQHTTTTYTALGEVSEKSFTDNNVNGHPHIITYQRDDDWQLKNISDNRINITQDFDGLTFTGHHNTVKTYELKDGKRELLSEQTNTIDPLLRNISRVQVKDSHQKLIEDKSYQLLRPNQSSAMKYAVRVDDNLNHVHNIHAYNRQGKLSLASTVDSKTLTPLETTTWDYDNVQLTTTMTNIKSGEPAVTTAYEHNHLLQLSAVVTTRNNKPHRLNYTQTYGNLSEYTAVHEKTNTGKNTLLNETWSSATSQVTNSPSTPKITTTFTALHDCFFGIEGTGVTKVIKQGDLPTVTNKQCFDKDGRTIVDIPKEGIVTKYTYNNHGMISTTTECSHNNHCQQPVQYEYYKNDTPPAKATALWYIESAEQKKIFEYDAEGRQETITVEYKNANLNSSYFSVTNSDFSDDGIPRKQTYDMHIKLNGTPIDVNKQFSLQRHYGTGKNASRLEAITYPNSIIRDPLPGVISHFNYNDKDLTSIDLKVDNSSLFTAAEYGFRSTENSPTGEKDVKVKELHRLTTGRIGFTNHIPALHLSDIASAPGYMESLNKEKNTVTHSYPIDNPLDTNGNYQKYTTYSLNDKNQIKGQYHTFDGQLSNYDYAEGLGYDAQDRLTNYTRALVNKPRVSDDPSANFDIKQTMNYNDFGDITGRNYLSPKPFSPSPSYYPTSEELYDKLAAQVVTQLQHGGTRLPNEPQPPVVLTSTPQGLVETLDEGVNGITTLVYDDDNQRLIRSEVTSHDGTEKLKTHFLYGPDERAAVVIEEHIRGAFNHYIISVELDRDKLYKWRKIYKSPSDDPSNEVDWQVFSYSKIPSPNPLSQVVVRHTQGKQTTTDNYVADILNYQYERTGTLTGQRGPDLTAGNLNHLVEQRFDPWGKRQLLFPQFSFQNTMADNILQLNKQGIDVTEHFTGHRSIPGSDLVLMGDYRVYSPKSQHFINPDDRDIGSDFSAYNRKMYANNNPVRYIDPDGHMFELIKNFFSRPCACCSSNDIDACETSADMIRDFPEAFPYPPPTLVGSPFAALRDVPAQPIPDLIVDDRPVPEVPAVVVAPVIAPALIDYQQMMHNWESIYYAPDPEHREALGLKFRGLRVTYDIISVVGLTLGTIGGGIWVNSVLDDPIRARTAIWFTHSQARGLNSAGRSLFVRFAAPKIRFMRDWSKDTQKFVVGGFGFIGCNVCLAYYLNKISNKPHPESVGFFAIVLAAELWGAYWDFYGANGKWQRHFWCCFRRDAANEREQTWRMHVGQWIVETISFIPGYWGKRELLILLNPNTKQDMLNDVIGACIYHGSRDSLQFIENCGLRTLGNLLYIATPKCPQGGIRCQRIRGHLMALKQAVTFSMTAGVIHHELWDNFYPYWSRTISGVLRGEWQNW